MQVFLRPYILPGILALVLFIISFFPYGATVDIHVHDTYFVVAFQHFILLTAFILLCFAFIYRITSSLMLSAYLTWIHLIASLLCLFAVLFLLLWSMQFPRSIEAGTWTRYDRYTYLNEAVVWILLLFIIVQVLLIINILGGVIRKIKKR